MFQGVCSHQAFRPLSSSSGLQAIYHQGPQAYHQGPQAYHQGLQAYHQGLQAYHQGPQAYHQGPQAYHQLKSKVSNQVRGDSNKEIVVYVDKLGSPMKNVALQPKHFNTFQ